MRPLIAGTWKMHGTAAQLGEIAAIAAAIRTAPPAADILVCPPSTLITRAVQAAAGQIAIGGQNSAAEISGAFTGDLSAGLLAIICIGETEAQRRSGDALSVCADQIAGSLPDGITASGNAIGYEPLWAIGTGHTRLSGRSGRCTRISVSVSPRVGEPKAARFGFSTAAP